MQKRTGIIYRITHKETGKSYYGQTTSPVHRRWGSHCRATDTYIGRSINKHGKDKFEIEEICCALSEEFLNPLEEEFILLNNTLVPGGYNLHLGPTARGYKMPEHVGKNNSERLKGNSYAKGMKHTEETKKNLSEMFTGRTLSEEWRQKISKGNRGKIITLKQRKLLRIANLGKKMSLETKEKISKTGKGRKHTVGARDKISYGNTGKVRTNKVKKQISKKLKGRYAGDLNPFSGKTHSLETKNKIKEYWEKYRRGEVPKIVRTEKAKRNISRGRIKKFKKVRGT